jgi:hypothetical protein
MKHLSEDLVKGILRDFPETRDSDWDFTGPYPVLKTNLVMKQEGLI